MVKELASGSFLSRKVYFYLIKWKTDDKEEIFLNEPFLRKVLSASYTGDRNIIEEDDIQRAELVQENPPNSKQNYLYLKLKRVRRKDIPIEEYDDTGEPYPYNEDEKRVFTEPNHFIIVNGNTIISELNVNGFRTRPYLYKVLKNGLSKLVSESENVHDGKNVIDFSIVPIPDKNFKEKIGEITRVKSMRLDIAPNYGHILSASKNSILKRLKIPKLIEKSHVVIYFSAGRRKETKVKLAKAFNSFRKSIIEGEEFQEEFLESLVVSGFTKNDEQVRVDLVEDFLHVETRAAKMSNRRGVDTNDMFAKLENAYEENMSYIDQFIL